VPADAAPEAGFELPGEAGTVELFLDMGEIADGGAGAPCETGADCNSGYCVATSDGKQCTIECTDECPFGWACALYTPASPDQVYLCVPRFVTLCRPCTVNADCWSDEVDTGEACVLYGEEGSFCSASCEQTQCPAGFDCAKAMDASGEELTGCILPDGVCPCTQKAADEGAWTTCFVENDWGICDGDRKCTAAGLTACSAETPKPEECNGKDDDCDEVTDEETSGAACTVTNGFGTCPGTIECTDGVSKCVGQEAKAELCDGEDNDCDQAVDETFEDTDKDGIADCLESDKDGDEVADGLDNCPTLPNPAQEDIDFDQIGDACDQDDDGDKSPDTVDCAPKDGDVFPGAEEVCNGKDDDCNYLVDEGFPDTDADGWKDCADTDDDGDGTPDAADCAPLDPQVGPGAEEVCDGVDNDCNFQKDEGFPDTDEDGEADCVDGDGDGDGVATKDDNCPVTGNPGQEDQDGDGMGDACDLDADGDSIPDAVDNCKGLKNTVQSDIDEDGVGDACDPDLDGDGVPNEDDNCPLVKNAGQEDADTDGTGDACEDDKDGDGTPDAQDCAPGDAAIHPGAAEVCDDADNDCDKVVDEGFPDSDADGLKNCVDGDDDNDGDPDQTDCAPLDPSVNEQALEVCDGKDNDCDTAVDNGLGTVSCGKGECAHAGPACLNGAVQVCNPFDGAAIEVCDGKDNDCDGLADEDLGATTCGLGICLHVQGSCVGGEAVKCDPLLGAGAEECDGLDNDCDAKVDEDQGSLACGIGACFHTIPACVGGVEQVCEPMQGAGSETCDGLDNDCDGAVDEGLGTVSCGLGLCMHTVDKCVDGTLHVCNPFEGVAAEECDGLDNDCDGLKDEELGQLTCGFGVCQHSVPACVNGAPGECNPLQGASEETCGDGLDNDCDGIKDFVCGLGSTGACVGKLCCDSSCAGACAACVATELGAGVCTPHAGGTDPESECGDYNCSGAEVDPKGASECYAACDESDYQVACKAGFHCDDAVCVLDVGEGGPCDEDTDCESQACRADWDGDGTFCAADEVSCVDDDGGEVVQAPDGWVECDEPDAWRACSAGEWWPAAPDDATLCGATTCDEGCGYATDEDNACMSGAVLGEDAGCEVADLGTDFECVDCGDLTAHDGACDEGLAACSAQCGADCEDGDVNDSGVNACFPDADGNAYDVIDSCVAADKDCYWLDDGHVGDTLDTDCGAFDCYGAGQCYTDCSGDSAKCNTGATCKDGKCLDIASALPWKPNGSYWVLTKNDGAIFTGNDCPGKFWGQDEPTVNGTPFVVGPYMAGSQLAGIKPGVAVPVPYSSWTVNSVYTIFPGGRCSGQPLSVTFNYTDGSSGTTGTANIPHDCGNGGSWSGSNFQIVGQGQYGGPCCDWWYWGKYTNPNPAKKVATFSFSYYDGCGGSYSGQMWATTVD